WRTDIRAGRQVVQERLATLAGILPEGIRPIMTPQSSIMGQIMIAGLHRRKGPQGGDLFPVGNTGLLAEALEKNGELQLTGWRPIDRHNPETWEQVSVEKVIFARARTANEGPPQRLGSGIVHLIIKGKSYPVILRTPLEQQMDLRTTADWVIRPRLLQVPGIAEVLNMGGERKQYQVLVDPAALLEFKVTLQQVEQAIKDNNINTSGGFTIEGQRERPVRVIGRLGPMSQQVAEDLKKVSVKTQGQRNILLGQVARIEEGPQPKRGDASIDGNPGVVITL